MLFNSPQFALFLLAILGIYRLLPHRFRNPFLLAASLLFYSLWLPAYLILLLADIAVNYALLRRMQASSRPKIYLIAAIAFTLGLLGSFKYAAMAVTTVLPFLTGIFDEATQVPDIFLPLGISFYSFQILALTIDTYRGERSSVPSLGRYALFISFFPQLVAGPILRGAEFLPQLERGGQIDPSRTRRGLWLLAVGLAKKVIMADYLLSGFVDLVFDVQGVQSPIFFWVALYSFAFQIYYDFSGYTDMARGIALLLGFEIPANFMEPYLSRNPTEFWRRWHITLSRWLADYLYIPLGGNRKGSARTLVNLMLTMLLGGLWHGASWNFVIWGGIHGLILVGYRLIGRKSVDLSAPVRWRDLPSILVFFHLACLAWVFFRAENFDAAILFIEHLFIGANAFGLPWIQIAVLILCVFLHFGERLVRLRLPAIRERLAAHSWSDAAEGAAIGILVALAIAVSGVGGDFIYFQF
ncbi:MAG: MBOAT family O-acyltransferase [Myxococcota bacterium]|jgi:alginate O-acetyltransferase complex protein AlgI|nr:MBOAT family O-acyltransferase [Myxococcota bacterium]